MAGDTEQREGGGKPITDTNNNSSNTTTSSGGNGDDRGGVRGEKYALRPRTLIKRLQQERVRQEVPKRLPSKSKLRPPPLSKYRRKTANARERHRMREINNAFETLRRVLPEAGEIQTTTSSSAITKIMTLRLAVEYIKALSFVLEDDETDQPFPPLHSCLHRSLPAVSIHHTHTHTHNHSQHQFQHQHQHQKVLQPPKASNTTHQYPSPASINSLPNHHHLYRSNNQRTHTQVHMVAHYEHCNTSSSSNTSSFSSSSSSSSFISASSPTTVRTSISSTSDLEDLLSEDSGLLEENFDVFQDIHTLTTTDPFDILLGEDKDSAIAFPAELCN